MYHVDRNNSQQMCGMEKEHDALSPCSRLTPRALASKKLMLPRTPLILTEYITLLGLYRICIFPYSNFKNIVQDALSPII